MSLYPPSDDNLHPPPELHSIRSARRSFGLAATLVSVGGFLIYVLLSGFAVGMMNQPLFGHLTIGLALGLFQFLLMAVTIWLYVRHMRERVDPVTDRLRAQLRDSQAQMQARAQASAQARPTPSGRRFGTW
ncbi:DUF485 domain-containing protein [Streptomyces sp. UG1]|uniref:DUF485 domain-containing protein n=1 Tax=Streptomyces sp. UG1 TaxID=3417652 RepID=UPI003CF71FE7